MERKSSILLAIVMIMLAGSMVFGAGQQEAKEAETYEMVFALHTAPDTIEHQAVIRFKENVEQQTNGQIVVKIFPGSQLGAEKENLEQIKVEEIQGSIFGDVMTSQLAPDLDPTIIPFVYSNVDDVFDTWEGPIGEKIIQACIEKGNIYVAGIGRRGARYLLGNKIMTTPESVKGLKLRLPEIPTWVNLWKGFGALPTPIAFSEVYSALQTKVVDSFESTLELTYAGKYYEVQKYAMKTEHLYGLFHFSIANSFLERIPAEMKKIVLDAAEEASKWGDDKASTYEAEMAKALIDKGMEIVEVDKAAFIAAAQPQIAEIAKSWQPGIYEHVQKYNK